MVRRYLMSAEIAFVMVAVALNAAHAAHVDSPETVVQAQLEAYNAHDIHRFMATYAGDAEIFEYPAKPLMKGSAEIEDFYANKRFNDTRLHATIQNRISMGDTVVDHESIIATFPEGPGRFEAIAIYQVQDGKIVKVTLIRGARVLDQKP